MRSSSRSASGSNSDTQPMPTPFRARREPQILDRASHGRQIHLGHGAASEYVLVAVRRERRHEQLAALEDSLDLEAHELIFALAQCGGGSAALLVHQRVDALGAAAGRERE